MRLVIALISVFVITLVVATPTRAMPDYATTTGEPCATCHLSPAGGGLRNLRGQAWVANEKPSTVPSTAEALKALGLRLPSDMSIYTTVPSAIPAPTPLKARLEKLERLLERLLDYSGN